MAVPQSINDIDLSPLPNKIYWNNDREWREEFIYFLMVDRFHDSRIRQPVTGSGRSHPPPDGERLGKVCGGTLRGVTQHLDYIKNLGCTALWLSPVFENNPSPWDYHGYAIQNYLDIDPRFGTKQDLVDLVEAAHQRDMRVVLDVVINHSGDNWSYPGGFPYYYYKDTQYPMGEWRYPDRPVPLELRNPDFYHRRGEIRNWDDPEEMRHGDFFSLKDFNNDEEPGNKELLKVLIKIHQYWIREADIDGFRMDAVKHMGALAVSRFSVQMREYAYSLGKRGFFLFGELIGDDDTIDRYIGPNTAMQVGSDTIYLGLSSVLDFPLNWVLPGVLKGQLPPTALFDRYTKLRHHALSRGEMGNYLVTFLDNHDQVGQDYKRRFAADSPDLQVIAGVGFLLCSIGITCLYYGTEQGLDGQGHGDMFVREPLFDLDDAARNYLNPNNFIYEQIAQISQVKNYLEPLHFGRMYFRETSADGQHFALPDAHPCTLAFSRILANDEVLVAYNTSTTEQRDDYIVVDGLLPGQKMVVEYGKNDNPNIPIQAAANGTHFIKLSLAPMEFAILQRAQ